MIFSSNTPPFPPYLSISIIIHALIYDFLSNFLGFSVGSRRGGERSRLPSRSLHKKMLPCYPVDCFAAQKGLQGLTGFFVYRIHRTAEKEIRRQTVFERAAFWHLWD